MTLPFKPLRLRPADRPLGAMPVCARSNEFRPMMEACRSDDNFMAHIFRSHENFAEVLKYTDGLDFKEKTAVVLYPASGYHIAPVAVLGEGLLKKYGLREAEFIYTEITGERGLKRLDDALKILIAGNPGWSVTRAETIPHPETGEKSFEAVRRIETPAGTITVRFKNEMSGEAYYDAGDLNRAHIVISHDIFRPHEKDSVREFVMAALDSRTENPENMLVIAEDFISNDKRDSSLKQRSELHFTATPYGCTEPALASDGRAVIWTDKDNAEFVDVGSMGLIRPELFELMTYGYVFLIDPERRSLTAEVDIDDRGYAAFDKFLLSRAGVTSWIDDGGEAQPAKKQLAALNKIIEGAGRTFGETDVEIEHTGRDACGGERCQIESGIARITIPTELYDPKIFDLFPNEAVMVEKIPFLQPGFTYELTKPGYKRAVIIRPRPQSRPQPYPR